MAEIVDVDARSLEEKMAAANKLKDEGNAFLAANKFVLAAERYTAAIELNPTAIFYSNRAQAMIKLESYGLAISDANEATKLDPSYIKAYYRRGSANYALGKLKAALKDFKSVNKIAPKDPDALKKMKACDKAIKEEAFLKAIESEALPEEIIDLSKIIVEDSYVGPRLETNENGEINVTFDFCMEVVEHFKAQKRLHRKYVIQILQTAAKYFETVPTLQYVTLPQNDTTRSAVSGLTLNEGCFTVCGDTHGQFYDLLNIFEINGYPSDTNYYLFNGDYVDRGSFSFETVCLLILIKLARPHALFMQRGNHETKNMNKIYGFLGEVKHKYDDTVMNLFTKVFNWLPLACVIERKVFCVHGGLSCQEGGVSLQQIENLVRGREPPDSGLFSELLWADPQPQLGKSPSKRGLGFSFGPDYTEAFLTQNKLQLVIRSHEVKDEGYVEEHNGKCITVFSAPNYCDQMGNKGAFIRFTDSSTMTPQFTKFESVPHPNVPPMTYAGNMFSL